MRAHSARQRNRRFAEAVAQRIDGLHRIFQPRLLHAGQQHHLSAASFERACLHTEQAHGAPLFPVSAEQLAHNLQHLRVELRGPLQRVPAGVGGEVRVAQFDLHLARVQLMFAQAAANHLGEPRQHGLQLVADRLRLAVGSNILVIPSARVVSPRLFNQRRQTFADLSAHCSFGKRGQSADGAHTALAQMLLGNFSYAGQTPHIERREKAGFQSWKNLQHAVGLGLIASDFGDHARGGDADRAVQPRLALHRLVQ